MPEVYTEGTVHVPQAVSCFLGAQSEICSIDNEESNPRHQHRLHLDRRMVDTVVSKVFQSFSPNVLHVLHYGYHLRGDRVKSKRKERPEIGRREGRLDESVVKEKRTDNERGITGTRCRLAT